VVLGGPTRANVLMYEPPQLPVSRLVTRRTYPVLGHDSGVTDGEAR